MKKQGEKKEAFQCNMQPNLLTIVVKEKKAGEIRDVISPRRFESCPKLVFITMAS